MRQRLTQRRINRSRSIGHRPLHLNPHIGGNLTQPRIRSQRNLQSLKTLLRHSIPLQTISNRGQPTIHTHTQRVSRIRPRRLQNTDQLPMQTLTDQPIHPRRQPARRPISNQPMNNLRMLPQPPSRLIDQRLHRRNMLPIIHNPAQNHANRASPLRLNHMLTNQTLSDPLKILIRDNLHQPRRDRQKLARKLLSPLTISDPATQRLRNTKIRQTLLKNLIIQEIFTNKSAQTIANLILLPRNQTRMRDRQTHRPTKQGRHRKPIRQRTNHAALSASTNITSPHKTILQRKTDRKNHSQYCEQCRRDELHFAKSLAPLFIGRSTQVRASSELERGGFLASWLFVGRLLIERLLVGRLLVECRGGRHGILLNENEQSNLNTCAASLTAQGVRS